MKNWRIVFLMLFGLLASGAARAEIHALIMTIGDYQAGIPSLKGVRHDRESARSIARLLGVKDESILEFHDGQLTLDGMQRAFDELDKRVAVGDKVFIYYSGHGSRQRVADPEDRCAESLVTVNGYGLTDAEMEVRLKQLAKRAQKIIALFDACHSGGATVRGIGNAAFAPKFWSKGGESACEKPVNVLTRNLGLAARSAGSGGNNYVYIAAAKDNEISLDQPGKGGVATQAWLACMSGAAMDTDRSGGLTVEEIRSCAQQKIDAQLKDAQGFLPHHINVTGNSDLVMTLAADSPGEAENAVTPAPVVQEQNLPEQAAPPSLLPLPALPEQIAPAPIDPAPVSQAQIQQEPIAPAPPQPVMQNPPAESLPPATFRDIFNGRDDLRTVEIMLARDKLSIGKDRLSFSVRSSHTGYLYLLMAGSDGKTFDLLFPNKLDGNNFIQAGQNMQLPRATWELTAQGPRGKDHILAIVADAPRDLAKLPMVNAGLFSVVAANSGGKRGIQLVTSAPLPALRDECATPKQRTLAVSRACSDAYGAALAAVEEVE